MEKKYRDIFRQNGRTIRKLQPTRKPYSEDDAYEALFENVAFWKRFPDKNLNELLKDSAVRAAIEQYVQRYENAYYGRTPRTRVPKRRMNVDAAAIDVKRPKKNNTINPGVTPATHFTLGRSTKKKKRKIPRRSIPMPSTPWQMPFQHSRHNNQQPWYNQHSRPKWAQSQTFLQGHRRKNPIAPPPVTQSLYPRQTFNPPLTLTTSKPRNVAPGVSGAAALAGLGVAWLVRRLSRKPKPTKRR